MKISEVMTRGVSLAEPNETICEVAKRMAEIDCGMLPVSEKDRLVGMITDRDIAVRGVAAGKGPDAKVRDIMTREVKYCFDDQDTNDVLKNMAELQIRRMPVLDHGKRLVGIVALADICADEESGLCGAALRDITQPGGAHCQSEGGRAG